MRQVIDKDDQLRALLSRIESAPWVGLDLEADSLHAYPEKVCLIQISLPSSNDLVDPLAGLDLSPLLEQLSRKPLLMHGADYDLRMLYRSFCFKPIDVFDTMEAARVLGMEQLGLTSLVAHFLAVELQKGSQKADWGKRPLTDKMIEYARNDVRYLEPLSRLLREQLEEKGRLSWHKEICERLIRECAQYPLVDAERVWRIKGSHRLNPLGLAILRELWEWREKEALRLNRPPFFVLRHDTLITIAEKESMNGDSMRSERLPRGLSVCRRRQIEEAVARAKALPAERLPLRKPVAEKTRPPRPPKDRLTELRERRDRHAANLEVDPSLIASRHMLELLAEDWESNQSKLMEWQRALLSLEGA